MSFIVPYRTAFVPEARVAAIPPNVASAPGSIGKNRPSRRDHPIERRARHAGLDAAVEVVDVDLEDGVHHREVDGQPAVDCGDVALERCAGAEGDERSAAARALDREGETVAVDDLGVYRFLLAPAGRDEARASSTTPLARSSLSTGRGRPTWCTPSTCTSPPDVITAPPPTSCTSTPTPSISAWPGSTPCSAGWREADRALELQVALRLRRLAGSTLR